MNELEMTSHVKKYTP